MAPKAKNSVANGSSGTSKKKDKSSVVLNGLVTDLFKRVETPLDPSQINVDHLDSLRAIHRVLLQIQRQERPLNSNRPKQTAEGRMQCLAAWLEEKGVKVQGIKFQANLPQGAGVVATKVFEKGDVVAAVPPGIVMSTTTALQSMDDVGLLCQRDPWLRAVPSLVLAMHLLFEKHRAAESPSWWKGYIDSLPGQQSLHDCNLEGPDEVLFPLAFSVETMEALKGSSALGEFHRMLRNVAKQYTHVYATIRRFGQLSPAIACATSWLTFAEFRWAVSMVMMRQNQIPLPGEGKDGAPPRGFMMALVPVLDMFNHEEGPITMNFDAGTDIIEVAAKRTFAPGDQVFMSYGSRPSLMMLLYSGFVPEHNLRDRIRLPVEWPATDALFSQKLALLKWLELPPSVQLDLFWDGSPSPELAMWLRVAALDNEATITAAIRTAVAAKAKETSDLLKGRASLNGTAAANGEVEASVSTDFPTATQGSPADSRHVDEAAAAEPAAGARVGGGQAIVNSAVMLRELTAAAQAARDKQLEKALIKSAVEESAPMGEHLDAKEGAILAALCKKRLLEFGQVKDLATLPASNAGLPNDKDAAPPVPTGLGLGLGGKGETKRATCKRELEMAVLVRDMEVCALQRAIARCHGATVVGDWK